MQIFATYECPEKSAQVLDDKRVIKMILESAQLLSNTFHYYNWNDAPLKKAFFNHPCSKFTRSRSNYEWLFKHFVCLLKEYTHRYNRIHSFDKLVDLFKFKLNSFPSGGIFKFVNCTPHKEITDINWAYRVTLKEKWKNDKRLPKWTNREIPEFYI